MNDIREPLYERYYSSFKKDTRKEGWKLIHLWLWYDDKYRPFLNNFQRDVPVLDLGCGSGEMLGYLSRIGFRNLIGIDTSEEQIIEAQKCGFNAIQADVFDFLRGREGQFEIIFAIDLIEHFMKDELLELLSLVDQALKPGGLFIIQTPNGEGLLPNYVIYGDLTHHTILSPLSLNHILTFTGFTNIRIKELGPGFRIHFPLWVLWQFIRLLAIIIKFVEIGRIQRCWTESIICICQKTLSGSNQKIQDSNPGS